MLVDTLDGNEGDFTFQSMTKLTQHSRNSKGVFFNLDMFAVSREVDLDDETRDVLTVANPVKGRSQRKVVEIYSTFN